MGFEAVDSVSGGRSRPVAHDVLSTDAAVSPEAAGNGAQMSKPVIFTISAAWDSEASVWSGHCDEIPAAADAPTLDELLAKISAMALDLLPDNHPDVAPEQLFLQITALREAEAAVG
jgi:hypothetical protein